jgi:hypothetical protein
VASHLVASRVVLSSIRLLLNQCTQADMHMQFVNGTQEIGIMHKSNSTHLELTRKKSVLGSTTVTETLVQSQE